MCQEFAVIASVSEFLCVGNVDQLPRVRWILASLHLSRVDFLPMQKGNEKGCTWNPRPAADKIKIWAPSPPFIAAASAVARVPLRPLYFLLYFLSKWMYLCYRVMWQE
ncbi:hypothetical protein RHGRI_007229 [Rhododendron griersonianum]|uniref:Uncharacterized protein n=1 Tax=Rhododendron griersonianum TaxID=479676 RepID=A0AAV6KWV0_9ERIC|nr:hypothetical protein RHGRI_007229 [Rhododendron griersonianum]